MKRLIVLISAIAITCSTAVTQNPGNYYTLQGGQGGQPSIRISELSDVLFNAAERFSVTPNVPGLFQGTVGQVALQIPAGSSQTISIDFTAKGETPATGLTYPDGYVYITFYYIYGPAAVSGRAKDNNGVWHDMQDWTNISSQAGNGEAFYVGRVAGTFSFMTALELTINASSSGTWLTKIEYHLTSGGGELKSAYVSKSLDNKLFSKFDFADATNAVTSYIHPDGKGYFSTNLGIGINNPTAQFHTTGTVRFAGLGNDNAQDRIVVSDANGNLFYRDAATISGSGGSGWTFNGSTVGVLRSLGTADNYDLPLITNNTEQMRITASGNVGIGTSTPQSKLAVNGDVFARKVKVTQTGWPDYVFGKGYSLPALAEIEQYIQRNKHLPDVPSAAAIEKEGADLGDNQAILLKKIEELTLYMIEQDKKIEMQQKRIEALENARHKK